MRDRSMRSGTELAREIKLTDWSMAGNLSNRFSGVQIPRDICTRLERYLYSGKCHIMFIRGKYIFSFDVDSFRCLKSGAFKYINMNDLTTLNLADDYPEK